jgi:hypothetical protein
MEYHGTKSHDSDIVTRTSTANYFSTKASSMISSSQTLPAKSWSTTVRTQINTHAKPSHSALQRPHNTSWAINQATPGTAVSSSLATVLPYIEAAPVTITKSFFGPMLITDTVTIPQGTTTINVNSAKETKFVTTTVVGPTETRVETHYGTQTRTVLGPGATVLSTQYYFGPTVETKTMFGPMVVTVTVQGPAAEVTAALKPSLHHASKPDAPHAAKPLPPVMEGGLPPPPPLAYVHTDTLSSIISAPTATIKASAKASSALEGQLPSTTVEEEQALSSTATKPAPETSSIKSPDHFDPPPTHSKVNSPASPATTIWYNPQGSTPTTLSSSLSIPPPGVTPPSSTSTSSSYYPEETEYNYVYSAGITLESHTLLTTLGLAIFASLWSIL